jgi:GntR family transcriptional regulator
MIEFNLDKKSPVPFYRQVVDMVLAGISAGKIEPGEKLPTIRDLAVKLEVNPNTVVKAYSLLDSLGALDTQQGSGVFAKAQTVSAQTATEHHRAVETICRDFVGRAQMLGIPVTDLIAYLQNMLANPQNDKPVERNS